MTDDRALMARTFAYLFGFGGLLVAVTLVLPAAANRQFLVIAGVSVLAFVVTGLCLWEGRRLPVAFYRSLPFIGILLVGVLVFSGGSGSAGAYELFSFWVVISAFYFFRPRYGLLCTALTSACYLVAMLNGPEYHLVELNWVLMTGALLVVGLLVGRLRARIEVLMDQLAAAARTDPLTGLPNRRELAVRLRDEIIRYGRHPRPFSVVALDLDGLKAINDGQGHGAGDRVLGTIGSVLQTHIRGVDMVARTGGDEFVVVAPGADADDATVLMERLRRAVTEACGTEATPVTFSAGIATYPTHASDMDSLLEAADRALYAAKHAGGNCTRAAGNIQPDGCGSQPSALY